MLRESRADEARKRVTSRTMMVANTLAKRLKAAMTVQEAFACKTQMDGCVQKHIRG